MTRRTLFTNAAAALAAQSAAPAQEQKTRRVILICDACTTYGLFRVWIGEEDISKVCRKATLYDDGWVVALCYMKDADGNYLLNAENDAIRVEFRTGYGRIESTPDRRFTPADYHIDCREMDASIAESKIAAAIRRAHVEATARA